ncbi:MAG: hypothetical protein IPM41_16075 [Sphingomonadales bacterium]|nr:hypothetical protein [Sphingomonadales bacterium]
MALAFQRQGIFGRRNTLPDYRSPWETPGFGDSIINRQAGVEPDNVTPNAMPIGVKEITKKPGFFGQGGAGRAIAGTIGDFLLQQSGMDPVYLPNILQQRDAEERARMAQQQRMQGREDFLFRENYKRDNPEPKQPDQLTQYMINAGIDPKSERGAQCMPVRLE